MIADRRSVTVVSAPGSLSKISASVGANESRPGPAPRKPCRIRSTDPEHCRLSMRGSDCPCGSMSVVRLKAKRCRKEPGTLQSGEALVSASRGVADHTPSAGPLHRHAWRPGGLQSAGRHEAALVEQRVRFGADRLSDRDIQARRPAPLTATADRSAMYRRSISALRQPMAASSS